MFRLIPLCITAAVLLWLYLPQDAPAGVYPIAPAQALVMLDRVDLPKQVFGDFKPAMRHWRPDDHTSMWAVLGDDDVELQRFKATLSPEGDGVRVTVEAQPPQGPMHDETAASMKDNPQNGEFLSAALFEQIDAKLTGRAFDMARLAPAFARLQVSSIPAINRMADAAAKADDARRNEAIDSAYDHEYDPPEPDAPSRHTVIQIRRRAQ